MNNDYRRRRLENAIEILENAIQDELDTPVEHPGELQYAQKLSIEVNREELRRLRSKHES